MRNLNTLTRFFLSFCFAVGLTVHSPKLYSQILKKKSSTSIVLQDFKPTDTKSAYQVPGIKFRNINRVYHYFDKNKLKEIAGYEKQKDWENYFKSLYAYVSNFGIKNFTQPRDMSLMWRLARVSEYYNQTQLTKEVYRLILKHYRGDVSVALSRYDKMIAFDKPLYAELDYYYKLIEKRLQIDTLRPPEDILVEMSSAVNSPYDDYGMSIGGKGDSLLIFTSKRMSKDKETKTAKDIFGNSTDENLFYSHKDEYGDWTEAKPMENLNSKYNEGSPCISKDGKTMYFVRCHSPEGLGDCDIYYSTKSESKDENGEITYQWSKPKNLGSNINSYSWDSHPALSMTEDTLYFSSARKSGLGGMDIYYSVKSSKGKWGKAKNAGPIINSKGNEVSPYPHSKYNVLYFSSDMQLLNFGGYDIFKSYIVKNQYTEPKNVGPLVNGPGNEFYFAIDSKSKWLFYAKSYEKKNPNMDLQSFPLPMGAKPNSTVRFTGRVVEPSTGEVFQGIVTIIDLSDGVEVAPQHIKEDGSFSFELIDHKKYLLVVDGDNFFRIEEIFELDGDTDMEIPAVRINSTITFKSIDFETNSAKLMPGMENNLHLIIDFLKEHPTYRLRVVGHTDADGDKDFNLDLSKRRAEAIRNYLISYGDLKKERVIAEGKGDLEPIIPKAKTAEDKRLNRRVEFKIFYDEYGIAEPTQKQAATPSEDW